MWRARLLVLRFLSVFATGEMGVQHSQEISVLDFIRDGAGAGEEDLRWSALPLSAVSSTKGVRALLNGSSLPVFGRYNTLAASRI